MSRAIIVTLKRIRITDSEILMFLKSSLDSSKTDLIHFLNGCFYPFELIVEKEAGSDIPTPLYEGQRLLNASIIL